MKHRVIKKKALKYGDEQDLVVQNNRCQIPISKHAEIRTQTLKFIYFETCK